MLTTEMIRRGAGWFADDVAVLFGDQSLTFAETDALSNRMARVLIETLGAQPGDKVGLLLSNSLLSIPIDFSCAKARLVRVPLNARLSSAEHQAMLAVIDARFLIYEPALAERAQALADALPELILVSTGPAPRGADLLALTGRVLDSDPALAAEPDDVVLALYTSGTTGVLKAAQHTQASYAAVALNILANLLSPSRGERMMHAASLIHASGAFVLPYWLRGGASVVLPGFAPQDYLAAVETYRPAALNLVPTMIGMLLETPGVETADFSSVGDIIYGASPMPRPIMRKALDLWGPRFTQYYGQTEAPLCIAVLNKADHAGEGADDRLCAAGRPAVDCELMLVDEAGRQAPAGEPGEIAVRAPFVMKGYHQAPELNAQTFLPGGWIRTRDVGRFDEAGYLHLIDRASDMIVTGGYNVYPREVEDCLAAHPAVREVVVVGLPDDKWGEAVTAFVALRDGHQPAEAAMIAYVRERLAGYKTPKAVRFIADIPKSAVGKPLRRAVRDPFWVGRDRRI